MNGRDVYKLFKETRVLVGERTRTWTRKTVNMNWQEQTIIELEVK